MVRISRRHLLLGAGAAALAGGGLVLSVPLARRIRADMRRARPLGGTAWIHIEQSGRIRAYSNVGEMGQGAITGLLQALADELDADWNDLSFEFAPVVEAFDGPYGHYTGGSTSIRDHFMAYRELGARARTMLIKAAADQWRVSEGACETRPGFVLHPGSGRRSSYAELAQAAGQLRVPRKVTLRAASQWRYIGKPMRRVDLRSKVDGSARFGIDVVVPGMRIAAVRHCPVRHGKLRSVSEEPALRVPGVIKVARLDDLVAVIADGYWPAQKGADALVPDWQLDADLEQQSTAAVSDLLTELLDAAEAADKLASPDEHDGITVASEYSVPLLAQCPLEPMNAIADVRSDRAELWVSTQAPSQCQLDVAQALGIPARDVIIHPQQMGGGFGRRLATDYAVEAALISRSCGEPVKVIWSRQEDFLKTSLRPSSKARMRARLNAAGLPTSVACNVAAPDAKPHTTGLSPLPYDMPAMHVTYVGKDTAARVGYWRSVDHSQNIFFVECFIDECAAAAKTDPLLYRRRLLHRNPGALKVLDALEKLIADAGGNSTIAHTGWAYFEGYGGRVAAAVQVRDENKPLESRQHSIFCVADCGLVLNPSLVEAQLQGALLQAWSAAMHEQIDLAQGRIKQQSFADYAILSLRECPRIHTLSLSDPGSSPSGVGELAVPVMAPALANAWAAATGTRFRSLPLAPHSARNGTAG